MIIKELIEKLKEFDQDMAVTVDGYEGGVSEKFSLREIIIALNANHNSYYGEHEEVRDHNFEKFVYSKKQKVLNIEGHTY